MVCVLTGACRRVLTLLVPHTFPPQFAKVVDQIVLYSCTQPTAPEYPDDHLRNCAAASGSGAAGECPVQPRARSNVIRIGSRNYRIDDPVPSRMQSGLGGFTRVASAPVSSRISGPLLQVSHHWVACCELCATCTDVIAFLTSLWQFSLRSLSSSSRAPPLCMIAMPCYSDDL